MPQWAPFWAFRYVITDLLIYPPPSGLVQCKCIDAR